MEILDELSPILSEVELVLENNPPNEFVSAHVILLTLDREITVLKERGDDFFNLPGGHRENSETALETAAREVEEELGLLLELKSTTYAGNLVFEELLFPLFFTSSINHSEIKIGEDVSEVKSFELDDFLQLVSGINPSLAIAIRKLEPINDA